MLDLNQPQAHPYLLSITLAVGFFAMAWLFIALNRLIPTESPVEPTAAKLDFEHYLAAVEAEESVSFAANWSLDVGVNYDG